MPDVGQPLVLEREQHAPGIRAAAAPVDFNRHILDSQRCWDDCTDKSAIPHCIGNERGSAIAPGRSSAAGAAPARRPTRRAAGDHRLPARPRAPGLGTTGICRSAYPRRGVRASGSRPGRPGDSAIRSTSPARPGRSRGIPRRRRRRGEYPRGGLRPGTSRRWPRACGGCCAWLGHERVSVLNGGFAAWQAARLPLESTQAPRTAARFIARPALEHPVTTQEVARELGAGQILLLDARGADRFAGQNETLDPVAGHVPGAHNQPFVRNLGADGRLLPATGTGADVARGARAGHRPRKSWRCAAPESRPVTTCWPCSSPGCPELGCTQAPSANGSAIRSGRSPPVRCDRERHPAVLLFCYRPRPLGLNFGEQ